MRALSLGPEPWAAALLARRYDGPAPADPLAEPALDYVAAMGPCQASAPPVDAGDRVPSRQPQLAERLALIVNEAGGSKKANNAYLECARDHGFDIQEPTELYLAAQRKYDDFGVAEFPQETLAPHGWEWAAAVEFEREVEAVDTACRAGWEDRDLAALAPEFEQFRRANAGELERMQSEWALIRAEATERLATRRLVVGWLLSP